MANEERNMNAAQQGLMQELAEAKERSKRAQLALKDNYMRYAESGARPDLEALKALAEDGLLVTWDKDFKFSFSQVVRLMADFAIEAPKHLATPASTVEAQTDWVSVEERLPETPEVVIVAHNNIGRHTYVARYKDGEWVRSDSDRKFYTAGVTHWQPLPVPPTPAAQPDTGEEKA